MSSTPNEAKAHHHYASRSGRVPTVKHVSAKRINDVVRVKSHSLVVSPRPAKAHVTHAATPLVLSHKVTGVMDMKRTPSHLKHHKPQHAQTLMRAVVRRPTANLRQRAKTQTRTDILVKSPSITVAPKQSIQAIDSERLERAEHVPKSSFIQRFAPDQASWFRQPTSAATTPVSHAQAAPKPLAKNKSMSMDIFQRALTHANAHEQPAVKPEKPDREPKVSRRRRPVRHHLISTVTASLAVLLLAGFFTYQNKADITLRFANAKAGFHASLPGYRPAGFATGRFHYSPGIVSVEYARAGTSRAYTVSQQVSSLNSESLLNKTIAPHNKSYQTLQQGGRTIYLYGNGEAAWVDKGLLYQIDSRGNLSTNDIVDIASSV